MAGFANDMSSLVNKIERRLGLIPLTPHLPKEFNKDAWVNVIKTDALVSFSRYYPYKVPYNVDTSVEKTDINGYYLLNEDTLGGATILGIADIDWADFSNCNLSLSQTLGYGLPDISAMNYGFEDIMNFQMRADQASFFKNNIYIDFKYPNKFKLVGVANLDLKLIKNFRINVLIEHPGLHTIPPTQMETFEALAQATVAEFLYNNLKYYEGIENVYTSIDMKLSDLQSEASKKEDIINNLKENFVSAGNDSIPIMITI